ncbi:fatty acid desaturas-like protein [Massariosphaeria phaeospora]|uniref:Fatty acid desaturas-like protein n=1 Tax=Massariosphaeria phaeospora TaxID=100035 RepID=A0A7C8II68_9PLEO|nr:fatty acid desaturas-like protein [Massariosphaeria phaeospora]
MVNLYFAPDAQLTEPDRMVLSILRKDSERYEKRTAKGEPTEEVEDDGDESTEGLKHTRYDSASPEDAFEHEQQTITLLKGLNNPKSSTFEPTVFFTIDTPALLASPLLRQWIIDPYIRLARSIVRVDTDVVMLTHLLLYFSTSVPSALYLFYHFRWWHGVLHFALQVYSMGTYTLMMHQHIHMRGILAKRFAAFDHAFPFLTDPLFGHTWNSYYFHHVKHHHVEGNGPNDLSSTVRYQRDSAWHFLQYVGRFYFFVWLDLPLYFLRTKKLGLALKVLASEVGSYVGVYLLFTRVNAGATVFTLLLPLLVMRLALMVGNWGQHAFVDEEEPNSDFRSSITLIDVASNRFCYNDGYHTSHHLNPLRHWRDHPVAFLAQKQQYADEHALVFYNIDYLMITFSLLRKDYAHLARCLVPVGAQAKLSLEERAELLRRKTRAFGESEIVEKWGGRGGGGRYGEGMGAEGMGW